MVGVLAGILVWSSLAGGGASRTGGDMVLGSSGIDKDVTGWLEIEGHSGIGGIGEHGTGLSLTRFGGGARLINVGARVRPFFYGGFAHWHEVGYDDWKKRPVDAMLSDTNAGVHHRTGLEAAVGVSWCLPLPETSQISDRLFYEARASEVWLPDPQGAHHYLMIESALGYRF